MMSQCDDEPITVVRLNYSNAWLRRPHPQPLSKGEGGLEPILAKALEQKVFFIGRY